MRICYIGWGDHIHTKRWLKWFARRGHEVHLLTNRPGDIKGVIEHDIRPRPDTRSRLTRYRDLQFNISWFQRLKVVQRVRRLLSQIGPDLLHLHTIYYPAYLGVYTGFHPMVVTPWDGDIVVWEEKKRPRWQKLYVWLVLRMADLITADSEELRQGCLRYARIKDDTKAHLVQWGVDLTAFSPKARSAAWRNRFGLPDDAPIVVSARPLIDRYNVDIVVRAVPLVLREVPSAQFIFLYHFYGHRADEFKRLAEDLGVADSVHFLGAVAEYNDLARHYAMADVYVSVSSWDTTSVSLLEAMACGASPVVGDLPSLREWIRDGWNGYVVPLRDPQATARAIVKLLKEDEVRQRFAKRNLAIVKERADHHKEMEKMERLYLSLLGSGK